MAINPFIASAGISMVGSLLGSRASSSSLNAQVDSVKSAISEAKNDYLRQLASTYEQEDLIDRETGMMLSASGLEALKAEGRLRAGTSGTGLTGISMQEAKQQSKYDQLFDSTVIIARSRKTKVDLTRERMSQYIAFKNRTQSYANQIPKPSSTSLGSALMTGLATGLNVYSQGVAMGGTMNNLSASSASSVGSSTSNGIPTLSQYSQRGYAPMSTQPQAFNIGGW